MQALLPSRSRARDSAAFQFSVERRPFNAAPPIQSVLNGFASARQGTAEAVPPARGPKLPGFSPWVASAAKAATTICA